ncbi:MAG: HAD family acid phosphatase [Gammaproteobacteria bacterium]|nr:HAD family acid phosphatase [Gammaproteobacteria bacterium]
MKNINQKLLLPIVLLLGMMVSGWAGAKEPVNLADSKATVVRYHDSGEYLKDQRAVIDQGLCYLKTKVEAGQTGKKLAIVLDIDETALTNYPNMLKIGFGGTLPEIIAAEELGDDPVIAPTLELYQYAKQHNVAVFFVTGRHEDERAPTEKNLLADGYKDWNKLILRSKDDHTPVSIWKAQTRAAIEKAGYDIVLNIGDQKSDLRGGYADLPLKLPNPFYLIP